MADVHSKEICSYNMSRIKGKNTKPEMLLENFFMPTASVINSTIKVSPGKPYLSMNSKATNKEDFYFGWYKILKCKSER
jgi:G:T-mismatch repair DNA endonuclease (very short patch repair protein)